VADLAPGTLVAGRYRLEHLLGEGGMGAVWAATHEITGGRVALKFLKSAGDPKSDARRRFLREARAATLVDHPNVVQIRDVVDFEDTPVLVMDLLQGETLANRLTRFGSFDLGEAARIGLQIVSAVGAAHEAGLIHRDLKPENVFLSRVTGSGEIVRVLDFGIAKLVGQGGSGDMSTNVTQSGTLIGTPAYMAPEQVFGERELDHRVDVWAIGVLMHEMLTGYRPVEGENYGQIAKKLLSGPIISVAVRRPDLPDDVIALVDHMLARERLNRLEDLREAVDVLAKYAMAKRPSFGPPRPPRITQDSGPRIEPDRRNVDPGAPTENVSSRERVSIPEEFTALQERAPADTLVAGSTPRPRQDTAEAHITASRVSVGPKRSTMAAAGLVGGIVVLAAIGMGVRTFASSRATVPPLAPSAAPTLAVPTIQPVPAVPSVVPMVASSEPSTTAAPPTPTIKASASVETPSPKSTAVWVKPIKPVVSAAVTATATTAPTPVPTPTGTNTGGLVTKPPF